jgi:hypothetical protein
MNTFVLYFVNACNCDSFSSIQQTMYVLQSPLNVFTKANIAPQHFFTLLINARCSPTLLTNARTTANIAPHSNPQHPRLLAVCLTLPTFLCTCALRSLQQ